MNLSPNTAYYPSDLAKIVSKKMKDLGRIEEKLCRMQECEIFEDLHVKSPEWQIEDERIQKKLTLLRFNLCVIYNQINEMIKIARDEE